MFWSDDDDDGLSFCFPKEEDEEEEEEFFPFFFSFFFECFLERSAKEHQANTATTKETPTKYVPSEGRTHVGA